MGKRRFAALSLPIWPDSLFPESRVRVFLAASEKRETLKGGNGLRITTCAGGGMADALA
ncbi:hypothetical protein ARTHRO9AX_150186 [Arthrobacter sp. 9AX]|nr:hypothetical protein ARTHRO9AX_150186 [Arthrobacter sp. 9AX]